MNKIFKVIYSKTRHCYVVVSELAKSHCKSTVCPGKSKTALTAAVLLALGTFSFVGMPSVQAEEAINVTNDYIGINTTVYDENGKKENPSLLKRDSSNSNYKGVWSENPGAITVGVYAGAGQQTVTIGNNKRTNSVGSVYIGEHKDYLKPGNQPKQAYYVTSVGFNADAAGYGSIAIGSNAQATNSDTNRGLKVYQMSDENGNGYGYLENNPTLKGASVAVGYSANAADGNVAIGAYSQALMDDKARKSLEKKSVYTNEEASSYVSVGGIVTTKDTSGNSTTSTIRRRISNVADGADATDVATVGQLQALSKELGGYKAGFGIQIDPDSTDKTKNTISLNRNLGTNYTDKAHQGDEKVTVAVDDTGLVLGGYAEDEKGKNNPAVTYGATGDDSVTVGGMNGLASGKGSVVAGGMDNIASGVNATVVGGDNNDAIGNRSSVFGGRDNTAAGIASTASGGIMNAAVGQQATALGGSNNYVLGANATAVGGLGRDYANGEVVYDSAVRGGYSVGIAGGSTGENAIGALAAGHRAVVTTENGTAIGYQATTDEAGTIAFGHDKGDVSGYTIEWNKLPEGQVNADGTANDYTKAPKSVTPTTYKDAYYNRLVKVADGQDAHDVVVMEQLTKATNNLTKDLSVNAGWGINIADEKDPKTGEVTKKNTISLNRNLGTNYGNPWKGEGQVTFEAGGENSLILGGAASILFSNLNDNVKAGAYGKDSVLVGGFNNLIDTVANDVTQTGEDAVIVGGDTNKVTGLRSVIIGGYQNNVSGGHSVVVGGASNETDGGGAGVFGGQSNKAAGGYSSVLGGDHNEADGDWSSAIGGTTNTASGLYATTLGGKNNDAKGKESVVVGGVQNVAIGEDSTVNGGAENTSYGMSSYVAGGMNNMAFGNASVALGGIKSNVNAKVSTGIAGGSTEEKAITALAAGHQSVVTNSGVEWRKVTQEDVDAITQKLPSWSGFIYTEPEDPYTTYVLDKVSTAVGYQSTADAPGVIAFGHDKGDVASVAKKWKQKATMEVGDDYSAKFYDANHKEISAEDYYKLANADGTWNDYTQDPIGTENTTYQSAYYNRLVKAADGIDAHDAVVMEQLKPYTKSDASNVGANLKTYTVGDDGETITETDASNTAKTTNENAWGTALGTGKIADSTESDKNNPKANGSLQLVTGGTVYSYNKPVAVPDKTLQYVKEGKTTGENLGILDATLNDKNHNIKYYAVDETKLPKLTNFNGKDYSNEKNDGAKGMGSMAAGFNTHADGIASTVAGSYSGVINQNGNGLDLRGATALSYGTFNINQNTDTQKAYSGVANSIVGQANMTTNSNAAIIYGAGNTVTDSYRPIDPTKAWAILDNASNLTNLSKAMQDAVKESGGQVMVMGGGNTVDKAYMTQVTGVGNTVTGADSTYAKDTSTQYNFVDGFQNELTNGKHDYIIGSNNTVSGNSIDKNQSNIVFGDNHKLTDQKNNVIIGSSDTTNDETTASDVVAIGHNAKVSAEGGVAIGSGSEVAAAPTEKVSGYDPTTKTQSADKTSHVWNATTGAVSIGTSDGTVTRQINGVAAGTNDTDAVNVAQLKKLGDNTVQYDLNTQKGKITLAGQDGTTITNVKSALDGAKDANGKDATIATATGDALKNAANLGDLQNVYNDISAKADKASTSHTALTVEGNTPAGKGKDEKTKEDVYAGKNILLHESTDENGKVTYDLKLAKDISIGKPGKDGEDGKIGIDGRDGHIGLNGSDGITVRGLDGKDGAPGKDGVTITGPKGEAGKDGIDGKVGISDKDGNDAVSISGKDGVGHIGLTGPAGTNGKDGASIDITVKNGYDKAGKDGKDGINGENGVDGTSLTRIVYEDKNGEHQVATLEDGLKFKGDDSTVIAKKLNNTMNIIGGADNKNLTDKNIGVNSTTDGQLKVQLAKDLTDITSISNQKTEGGKTTGAKITLGTDGTTTITGGDINVGGNKVTNIKSALDGVKDAEGKDVTIATATGDALKNAANLGDLQNVYNDISAKADKASTSHTALTVEGNTPAGKGKDEKTKEDVYAGKNILLHESTDENGKVTYDLKLAKDISIGKPGKDGEDGKIGIDGRDGHIGLNGSDGITVRGLDGKDGAPGKDGVTITGPKGEAGKDGIDGKVGISDKDGNDAVSISGKDGVGHIGLTGPAGTNGKDGASIDITVKNGYDKAGKDGKDGINGENGVDGTSLTRIVYEDKNGEHQVATLEDGLKFKGDDSTVIAKKLNNTMNIIGGADNKNLTDKNIGVNSTTDGQLKVQLAKDLTDITSISNQKTEGGKTTGAKITLGIDGSVNVNGGKITNVGSGIEKDIEGNIIKTNVANIGDVQDIVNKAVNSAADTTNKALEGKANIDASNIGANLKGADGSVASAEDQKANAKKWGSAIGTGEIKADDGRMVTGKTVYDEVRPKVDGSYVKKDKTTGENLSALDSKIGSMDKDGNYIQKDVSISSNLNTLDTQVKANADAISKEKQDREAAITNITNNIGNLSDSAVKYDANTNKTKITLAGEGGTTITNVKDGALSKNSTDAVNGKQLYEEQQAREKADAEINQKVTNNTNEITKIKNGNFTDASKTAIHNIAKDAVKVVDGKNTTVTKVDGTDTTPTTYAVNVEGTGKVDSGDTGLISGGTLYNEVHVTTDGSYIKSNNTVGQNLSALDSGLKTTSDLIHTNTAGDTIQIGGNSTATKIDVNGKDGKGRVITGVVTDASDPNSAANVGYVNGLTAANTQQIYRDMSNAYSRLDTNINRAAAGSNALAALHPLDFDPADKASFAVGYGHYRNANAAAVGAFYQPNANTMVNMGISLGNGDPGFNAGVSFKIGKGSAYNGVSKAEMAQTIHDQATEISAIKADDAAKDKRIDALEKENQEMKKQIQEILARLNG